jgi:hypothetical protein
LRTPLALALTLAAVLASSALPVTPANASLPEVDLAGCPAASATPVFAAWGGPGALHARRRRGRRAAEGGLGPDRRSERHGGERAVVRDRRPGPAVVRPPPGCLGHDRAVCVDITRPTMRFFARRTGSELLGALLVELSFQDASASRTTSPSAWSPPAGTGTRRCR